MPTCTVAVIGDLHTLDPASHGLTPGGALPLDQAAAAPDAAVRYHAFTERLLPLLLAEVRACRPDLVIHTGDLAETGYREPAGSRELAAGLRHLQALGAPLLLCRGNHDGDLSYRDLCGPLAPLRWDGPGLHVLTLDDPRYAAPGQMRRLEADLAAIAGAARGAGHILLAAHEPAYPLARPFFSDPGYARALRLLAAQYPVEALCCGHTHNLAWSVHGAGPRRWLQLKAAAVGFPQAPRLPLAAVRALFGGGAPTELLWGYLEDGAPGWEELIVDGDWVVARWHALGEGVGGELRWRRRADAPGGLQWECPQRPPQQPPFGWAWPVSARAAGAALHLAGYGGGEGCTVRLNGRALAALPGLASFAPRVRLALPAGAVRARNRLEIETRPQDHLLVGALALEVWDEAGRAWRTPVDPWLHATAPDWDGWGEPRLRVVPAGGTIAVDLAFA
jgi:hypothetical protein